MQNEAMSGALAEFFRRLGVPGVTLLLVVVGVAVYAAGLGAGWWEQRYESEVRQLEVLRSLSKEGIESDSTLAPLYEKHVIRLSNERVGSFELGSATFYFVSIGAFLSTILFMVAFCISVVFGSLFTTYKHTVYLAVLFPVSMVWLTLGPVLPSFESNITSGVFGALLGTAVCVLVLVVTNPSAERYATAVFESATKRKPTEDEVQGK